MRGEVNTDIYTSNVKLMLNVKLTFWFARWVRTVVVRVLCHSRMNIFIVTNHHQKNDFDVLHGNLNMDVTPKT